MVSYPVEWDGEKAGCQPWLEVYMLANHGAPEPYHGGHWIDLVGNA